MVRDSVLKPMTFALKMMNFVFKMRVFTKLQQILRTRPRWTMQSCGIPQLSACSEQLLLRCEATSNLRGRQLSRRF